MTLLNSCSLQLVMERGLLPALAIESDQIQLKNVKKLGQGYWIDLRQLEVKRVVMKSTLHLALLR